MHLDGHSWTEISEQLGFRSRSGARLAVNRHLATTCPDAPSLARRKWIDGKVRRRARLLHSVRDAQAAGDHQSVAQLSRAIDTLDDQLARAGGYYVPAQSSVNVTVSASRIEAVESWRREMLERSPERPGLPMVDVEPEPIAEGDR